MSVDCASNKFSFKVRKKSNCIYLRGFYDGVLKVGKYSGKVIKTIKKTIQQEIIDSGDALVYYEPLSKVVSRLGDECYVALVDQWYLNYSDENWKSQVLDCINKMHFYDQETKNRYISVLDWLEDHSCSRQYGIGTKLPFSPNEDLIESLSDSTIYMAYYTIAHLLQVDVKGILEYFKFKFHF